MKVITFKKTLNLHKYSLKAEKILTNRKITIPVFLSILGVFTGCYFSKGEGMLSEKVISVFLNAFMTGDNISILTEFLRYLLIPSVFAAVEFFLGLSLFGAIAANAVPFGFSVITGIISYFLYKTYLLKGLAYCVILIFPYAVVSIIGMVFCCRESVNMSEFLLSNVTKSKKYIDYNFSMYCKSFFKGYIFILIAAGVKAVIDYLFIGLFNF